MVSLLDDPYFLEGSESTVLLDGAEALSRDVHEEGLAELRDEDVALLEVSLAAYLSGRVELSSTRPVRVPSAYLGCLSCYCAASCHSPRMLP